jgi:restriction endonuclease S subunit
MITHSIIRKSQLERGYRLDAEYYQPEYLEVAEKVNSLPHQTLEGISESIVSFGAYSLTNFIEWQDDGIPFIVAENIKEGFISYEGARYISDKTDEILKKSRVRSGQVLLSMSGSVGNAAVAHKIPPKLNSNQDIVKINLKQIHSPYVLTAFLNGKYGRMQVLRLPVGSVQQHIFLWQTKSLLIPIFRGSFVNNIEKIYREGLDQLENSRILYSEAEDLLLEELGLKDFKPKEELSYVVNLSNLKSTRRVDAEYFQPKYRKIEEKLVKDFDARNIKYLDSIKVTTGQYSEEYVSEANGKPYIRGTDLTQGTVNLDNLVYINTKRQIPSKKAKEGDVVVTRVGSIGISARLPKEVEGGTISDNLIRLRFSEENLNSYYVSLYFNTIGSQLMIRESRGSVQARLNQETLKEIVLPILPEPTQQRIADLIRQSHEAGKRAKDLLEKAKKEVEEFIEKKQLN